MTASILATTDNGDPAFGLKQGTLARTVHRRRPAGALRKFGGGPVVVGLDAAGDIIGVGRDLTGVRVGDRVMALVNGGLSQEVVVDAALTVPIPRGWSYAEGAAGILGLLTETETADVVAALRAETDLGNEALRPTIDQVV